MVVWHINLYPPGDFRQDDRGRPLPAKMQSIFASPSPDCTRPSIKK